MQVVKAHALQRTGMCMASFGQASQHIRPCISTFIRCMAVCVQAAREPPDPGGVVVLVAKALTKSDTAGRVILPRVSVESNLSFLTGYRYASFPLHPPSPGALRCRPTNMRCGRRSGHAEDDCCACCSTPTSTGAGNPYMSLHDVKNVQATQMHFAMSPHIAAALCQRGRLTCLLNPLQCRSYGLPVRDREGRRWDFVVKSWANGTEHRRVYVLEHALEFISARRLREGDAIGLCADAHGALVVEVLTHT